MSEKLIPDDTTLNIIQNCSFATTTVTDAHRNGAETAQCSNTSCEKLFTLKPRARLLGVVGDKITDATCSGHPCFTQT